MRISFLGKGGSGKTTMATSFIKYLNKKQKDVLAVDADINVHLGSALEMATNYIGDRFDELSFYFERERILEGKAVIGTTPPSMESNFILPILEDSFLKKYATYKDHIALLSVGTYTDSKVGYACYHSKLGNAVLMYNRLLDNENFYVVTDATAGIDSVGTSMFYVSDINVFVVEPTKKSIQVLKDFLNITSDYHIKTYVIANKIENNDDIEYIKSEISEQLIIGYVKSSQHLRRYEQGNVGELDQFIEENDDINSKLLTILDNTEKDWDQYYEIQKQIYIDDAGDWYSQYYNQDLPSYIDENFKYEKVIEKYEVNSQD